jgi:hypothetical protein
MLEVRVDDGVQDEFARILSSGVPAVRRASSCELAWFSLSAPPDHLIPYCRTALTHITADQRFSVYGW